MKNENRSVNNFKSSNLGNDFRYSSICKLIDKKTPKIVILNEEKQTIEISLHEVYCYISDFIHPSERDANNFISSIENINNKNMCSYHITTNGLKEITSSELFKIVQIYKAITSRIIKEYSENCKRILQIQEQYNKDKLIFKTK